MPSTQDGYEPVARVLREALDQTQNGKGKERHASDGLAFADQPMMGISRLLGSAAEHVELGGVAFQAIKKTHEAIGMVQRGKRDAAKAELLGAIVYLAGMVLLVEDNKNG